MIRLQKVLAEAGVASRREAERMITGGRVKVNGTVVTELGKKADPERDKIEVDGKPLSRPEKKVYYILNKPTGYVTTIKDPEGRPTVADLIGDIRERVYPVGRLDYDTSGILLITNDGELANALAHPAGEVEKCYNVKVKGVPGKDVIERLAKGVMLEDGKTAPARVKILKTHKNNTWLEVIIHEGRKRQVRRMCEAVGHRVLKLKRVRFGPLALGDIGPGKIRELDSRELKRLKELTSGVTK